MKKLIKIFLSLWIFFFGFSQINASEYIIYSNSADSNKIYRKNANDTTNWTAITISNGIFSSYSPDWQYIIYTKPSDSNKIYRKNANDTSDWTAITSVGWLNSIYSPDWQYIIYSNSADSNKIYRKNANDTTNWAAITSVGWWYYWGLRYSPDWQYIVYAWSDLKIYRKNANDTTNWTAITSVIVRWYSSISYSPDWQYIIYFNDSDWSKIYRKNANDTTNWTAITSVGWYYYWWTDFSILETCTDWIQNQDETWIDVWWVCWENTFTYTWTGAAEWTTCNTKQYYNTDSVTWYNDFWLMTPTAWALAWNVEWWLGWEDSENNWLDKDIFRWIYFGDWSYVPHEVMQYQSSNVANVEYLEDRITALSAVDPRIRIIRKRNWELSQFNIMQVSWSWTYTDWSTNNWATHATNWYYIWSKAQQSSWFTPCTDDGEVNTCTIIFPTLWTYADLHIWAWFTWVRFWITSSTENKVFCENDSYSCNWRSLAGSFICSWISNNPDWYPPFLEWSCGITAEGYCAPLKTIRNKNAYEDYVYNWSWEIIWIVPSANSSYSNNAIIDDLFSCPNYVDWTDFGSCVIQIFKNWYWLVKNSINSATSESDKSISGNLKKIWSSTWSATFWIDETPSWDFAAEIFRKSRNKAFEEDQPFTQWGRSALYMTFVLIFIMIVLSIWLISHKQKE